MMMGVKRKKRKRTDEEIGEKRTKRKKPLEEVKVKKRKKNQMDDKEKEMKKGKKNQTDDKEEKVKKKKRPLKQVEAKKRKENRTEDKEIKVKRKKNRADDKGGKVKTRPLEEEEKKKNRAEDKEIEMKRNRMDDREEKARKKKRPWRQAVRNRARHARKLMEQSAVEEGKENQNSSLDSNHEHEQQAGDEQQQQQEQKKKKAKLGREKRLRRLKKMDEEAEKDDAEEDEAATSTTTRQLDASRFRFLNEQLYRQSSTASAALFREDPAAFRAYHRGYKLQVQKWPVNPLDKLVLDLGTLPAGSVIADLGCGDAQLAKRLSANNRFKVYSFDLVANNERVVEADMAALSLDPSSVDVCVYCLSLMGTNLAQFMREAHRVLKMKGKMKIVEIASRFRSVKQFVGALEKMGFHLKRKKELGNGFFVMLTLEKMSAKMENKRPLGLHLEPCLYKKR